METKRWLSIPEAARYLSVTVFCVRSLLWSGAVPFTPCGKRYIIDREDLDRWAQANKQSARD